MFPFRRRDESSAATVIDPPDMLAEHRERAEGLAARLEELREEEQAAEGAHALASERLEQAEAGFAEGTVPRDRAEAAREQVARVARTLELVHRTRATVESSLREERRAIEVEERRVERERQTREAAPALAEADRLFADGVQALAAFAGPLMRRAEILDDVERRYPLAPVPGAITLDAVTKLVRKAWHEGTPVPFDVQGDPGHGATEFWVRRLINGPTITGSGDQHALARLRIK